jgi:predicted esterase
MLLAVLALLALPASAGADGGVAERRKGPCDRCLSSLPAGSDPRPLLVLLHGDGETAASMFDAWQARAAARDIAVLALDCPVSEGCSARSWWRWNGDPAWIDRQTVALGELRPIDRERMWIVGWSGGASYIGLRTQELERTFAAIVIHGGGVPPPRSSCDGPKAAVTFLVGDANPLHYLAVGLREYYERCEHDVTWTLLRGADHGGERRALAAHREEILDWLGTRRLVAAPGLATAEAGTEPSPAAPSAVVPTAASSPPAIRSSCMCSCPGTAGKNALPFPSMCLLIAVMALARARMGRRRTAARNKGVNRHAVASPLGHLCCSAGCRSTRLRELRGRLLAARRRRACR